MAQPAQRVVLINGPAGVGKTTVGRALAATVANGVCIHGDDLKHFVVARAEPPTVETGLSYLGGAALTDVYLSAGYELVVFDFVFPTAAQVRRFEAALRALRDDVDLRLVTLWAARQVVVGREHGRADREPLGVRVEAGWCEMAGQLDDLGELAPIVRADGSPAEVLAAAQAALASAESTVRPDQEPVDPSSERNLS